MLSITGACRRIGAQTLFNDLDLSVNSGDCVAVVGPNGAGKSTLLRCIIDEDALDDGEILIAGQAPDDRSAEFRRRVAAEVGDQAVFFDATLAEHLDLRAVSHGIDVDVGSVLRDAGIGDLADRFPHTLSTGQRQRFSLAAVFMVPADLLVLDEPERGLDTDGQEWVAQRINRATVGGRAVVVATHSPFIVERCADRVVEIGR